MSGKVINVGFIGNPNCGKTTLFNAYTGANLKVANWPGVTVEKKEGKTTYKGQEFKLIDLPGIYSLTSYTMEEKVSRECIMSDEVDVIVDVVDASSLERNLYLTLQLIELGKPVVLALNMMDVVEERGMEIDLHRLPEMLGIPAIPVSARKRSGLEILMHAVAHHNEYAKPGPFIHHHPDKTGHRHDHHSEYAMVYDDVIEDKIDAVIEKYRAKYPDMQNMRWHAIKVLEQDQSVLERYPVDHTNNPLVAAQNDNLVAINSALQVDLFGQVAAEAMGPGQFSGVGGQVDFFRSAALSRGGRAILALPSTAAKGTQSRIVAALPQGSIVTSTRNDVDYVVTEYGVAPLRGRSVRQRAENLIAIAHPDFRDLLRTQWEALLSSMP